MENSTAPEEQKEILQPEKRNTPDYWARGLGFVSIFITIIVAIYNYNHNRTVLQQHITPSLTCYAELTAMIRHNKPVAGTTGKDLLFAVENIGPLPVASFSVDTRSFDYNKKSRSIPIGGMGDIKPYRIPGQNWIFIPEFEVGKLVQGSLLDGLVDPIGWVQVFQFNLHYFRKSDMQDFWKSCVYFIDDGKLFSHSEYVDKPQYKEIMTKVEEAKQKFNPEAMKNIFQWRGE